MMAPAMAVQTGRQKAIVRTAITMNAAMRNE